MKRIAMAVSLVVCACGASALGVTINLVGQPDRLKPGDSDYPVESEKPTKTVVFTAVVPPWLRVHFKVVYMPALSAGRKPGEAPCTGMTQDGVAAVYSVSLPLPMSSAQNPGAQGKSYRGTITVDRFKPGRCHWEFVEVRYVVEDNAGEEFRLFRYDSIADRRTSDSVDFLCTRVPAGYVSPDPHSKLREVACQSAQPEQLDRHLLLKRAAVAGSGEWGWNTQGTVSASSITAFFHDAEVPIPHQPVNILIPHPSRTID